jgi:8-oxo-dGTP pyrophosphatase MutT (NUDIX family)
MNFSYPPWHDGDTPVIKIGAVVLRGDGAVLIVQPKPKRAGEVAPFVLPRGTRQYQDDAGAWHDARDLATAQAHAATLEPVERGLAREVEEEAGIDAAMLAQAQVRLLGVRPFQSRSKGIYPIYWYVVTVTPDAARRLEQQTPVDTLALRWALPAQVEALAVAGEFSSGYLPVIAEALELCAKAE